METNTSGHRQIRARAAHFRPCPKTCVNRESQNTHEIMWKQTREMVLAEIASRAFAATRATRPDNDYCPGRPLIFENVDSFASSPDVESIHKKKWQTREMVLAEIASRALAAARTTRPDNDFCLGGTAHFRKCR